MATTLYLREWTNGASGIARALPEGLVPSHATSALTAAIVGVMASLDTSAGSTELSSFINTVNGPVTAPGQVCGKSGVGPLIWLSAPLSASATISGTVTFNAWAAETNMSANASVGYVVWRIQPDGTSSVIISSNRAVEATVGTSTTTAESSWTGTPTSTSLSAGDVIAVAGYFDDSSTMAAGYNGFLNFNGATQDSFVQFTENLTFDSMSPSGTVTRLLAAASDVSGGKKLWTDAAGSSATYVVRTVTEPAIAQWTDVSSGTAIEWYTPQLDAVTVSGPVKIELRAFESLDSVNASTLVRIYKTDSDGSNPVLVGSGRSPDELTTSATTTTFYATVSATLVAGQRLKVRVYTSAGYTSQQGGFSSLTASLVVEGATSPTVITWPTTLTEHTPVAAATLTDDFSTKDTTTWAYGANGVSSGRASLLSNTPLYTLDSYVLEGSSVYCDMVPAPSSGDKRFGVTARVAEIPVNNTCIRFKVASGTLEAGWTNSSGTLQDSASVSFSETTTRYCRIREASGTIYCEYSSDASSWTTLDTYSVATIEANWGFSFPEIGVFMYAGTASQVFEGINVEGPSGAVEATASFAATAGFTATAFATREATASFAAASTFTALHSLDYVPRFISLGTPQALTSGATVPYPASIVAGDIILFYAASVDGTLGTEPVTAGFTLMSPEVSGGGVADSQVWWKIATGSESGSISLTAASGTKGVALMTLYRSIGITAALSDVGVDSTSGTTFSVTSGSIQTLTDDLIVWFGLEVAATTFASSPTALVISQSGATVASDTQRVAARTSSNTLAYLQTDALVTAGGTGAITGTATTADSGSGGSGHFIILRYGGAASASFAATSTFTATAAIQRDAAVTVAATSTFTATGTVSRAASVTMAASSTFTATGFKTTAATVTMSAASTFTATAAATRFASVSYAATSTFTATGTMLAAATVTYTALSGFTATGLTTSVATVTYAAASTFTATGLVTIPATVTMSAVSTFSAAGDVTGGTVAATATFAAVAALTVAGAVTALGAVTYSATATFTVLAFLVRAASVTLAAASSFTAVAVREAAASVSMSASSTFTAAAYGVRPATVTYAASSTFTAVGFLTLPATLTLAASSTFTATGSLAVDASVAFPVVATFTAVALVYRLGMYKPNALYAMSGLTGTYADIDDSPDTPDANALVPTGGAIAVRIGFEEHGNELRTDAGDQMLRVVVSIP